MKKSILLFVAIFSLSLASCSSDDSAPAEISLIGKWEPVKTGAIVQGQEMLQDFPHTQGCTRDYYQFTASTMENFTFDVNSNNDCFEFSDSFSYTRNGNTVLIFDEDEDAKMEILLLDAATLKLKTVEYMGAPATPAITIFKRI